MREHPILFSAPMVRAILDGRKTQTRRLAKLPHINPLGAWEVSTAGGVGSYLDKAHTIPASEMPCIWHTRTGDCIGCKYHVGDHLYVREAFSGPHEWSTIPPAGWGWDNSAVPIWYWADGNPPSGDWTKPKPGIHLPRRYSRIALEVIDVRAQRLQEISGKDILAEGAVTGPHTDQFGRNPVSAFDGKVYLDLISLWAKGWDSINAKRGPFVSNPFVWAITFKMADAQQASEGK